MIFQVIVLKLINNINLFIRKTIKNMDSILWLYHTLKYVRHIEIIFLVILLKLINIINLSNCNTL